MVRDQMRRKNESPNATQQNCIYNKVIFIILLAFVVLLPFGNALADDQVIQKWADVTVESDIKDENNIVLIPAANYQLYINANTTIDVNLPIYSDRPDYEINSLICRNTYGNILEKYLPLVIATQNAKEIVYRRGLSPNFYAIIPVPEPAWIVEINGWSGLHYFVPSQATQLYRALFLCRAFEDQTQDVNGHVTRFYYYKEAFYEAVLQRELNYELYSSGDSRVQVINEAEKLLKLISSLGSLIPEDVKADVISYLQRLVELGSQGVPDTLEISDTLGGSFQSLTNIIKNYVGDIDLSKKVSLLGRYLNALPLATMMVNDIVQYLAIQSFIIEPEIQKRIDSLDEIQFEDEVAFNAYQEVKAEINSYSLNYFLEKSGLEADDLLDYAGHFIPKLMTVPGIPAALALWVGIHLVIDILSDANSFLFLTAIATLQQELATQLRPQVDVIDCNNIGYENINNLVRLLSIENTLDYTYFSVLKRIYEFNYWDPNSWIQQATYFTFSFLGYDTYFDFISELQNILHYKLHETSRVQRFILFAPYYLADIGTCDSFSIECPGNVVWLATKVVAGNDPFFSNPIISPANPNINSDVSFSITYNDYDEDLVDAGSVKVIVDGNIMSMTSPSNQNGAIFTSVGQTFSEGSHSYYFIGTQGGEQFRYPIGTANLLFYAYSSAEEGHDVGVEDVSWDSSSAYNPKNSDLVVNSGESIRINAVAVYNYGSYTETNVPIIMQITDPDTGEIKANSNTRYLSSISPSAPGVLYESLTINTGNFPNLANDYYKLVVKTMLSSDNDNSNDSLSWDLYIGTPARPPEQLPLQSYYYYDVAQTGSSSSMSTTISTESGTYHLTLSYVSEDVGRLTISGSCNESWNSIEEQAFYSVCSGDVFISLQGCTYFGQYFLDLEIGVKSNNPDIQQDQPFQAVKKWGGSCGLDDIEDTSTIGRFDVYSQSGDMDAWLIGYNLDPRSLIDSYINTWTFSDRDACGGYQGNYNGSLLNGKVFSSTGRYEDDYLIVPSTSMPSGDYNFVIIHRPPSGQSSPNNPQIIGYAHSIRLQVLDRHDLSVGSIQLPATIQSGNNTYNIAVPITNNGDVDETNVSVNLSISNDDGYRLLLNKEVSINQEATFNVNFNWNTLGLPAGTYYFYTSALINDDEDLSDNSSSTQKELLPPPLLSITCTLDKTAYSEGEQILLTATTAFDAIVTYVIKDGSDSVVDSGSATDPEDDGSYNASPNAPLMPGDYTVEVTATKIGYLPGTDAQTFAVNDTKPPTVPILISPSHGSFITNSLPTMDWNDSTDAGSGIAGYEIKIDDDSDCSSPLVQANPITSSYTVASQLQDGTYYWRVRAKDNAGNPTDPGVGWATPFRFTVDTENPAVTITSPTSEPAYETDTSPITISGVASDGGGLSSIRVNTGDINNGTLENWSFPVDLVEGTNSLTISATDIAGNVGSDTISIDYTPLGPDIALDPPSYDFGDIPVGNFFEKVFVVSNKGNDTLHVTGSSIVGDNPDQFSIVSGSGSFDVEPRDSHNITVRFSPTSTGSKSAFLRISSNDPDENQKDVTLTGNATLPSDLRDGLVGYYLFNGNAHDASGSENHGTVHGATLTTDRFGNSNSAYDFDGGDDYVDCGNNSSLNITEAISLVAWINPRSLESGRIISKWGLDSGYELDVYSDNLRFSLNQQLRATSSFSGMENIWIFLGATWDGSNAKLYVNAYEIDSSTFSGTLSISPHNLLIGEMANFALSYFSGIIDDVRIYNRAVSRAEIIQLSQLGPEVDTDGDGITDDEEIHVYGTDPNDPDTDEDGLLDGDEVAFWNGFPDANWNDDSDGDGLINLLDFDSDNDGFSDGQEVDYGTDPNDADDYPLVPGIFFVDGENGEDANSGRNWVRAKKTLQAALVAAQSGEEIWVAGGIYIPGTDRTDSFQLKPGVALYGGFRGTETSPDERDWKANETILSGDINGDDIGFTNNSENAYHVVTGADGAIIDGFTITAGNANGSYPDQRGGGIYSYYCSPRISNCTIYRNSASGWGGGINNNGSTSIINDCLFIVNSASTGGGIHNDSSSPSIINCIFSGNSVTDVGGGMYNYWHSSPTVTNCTFSGNSSERYGGGMSNFVSSSPAITNCILWGNTAQWGPEIDNKDDSFPTLAYCDIDQDGYEEIDGNIRQDPLFADPANGDLHLQGGSPCIDTGTNDAPAIPDFDIEGNPRRMDGDNDGTATADMGAYEYVPDADGDGIYDLIDTEPATFSNDFSDVALDPPGTTTGTILDRGDQTLAVTEEPNPAGVRIRAVSSVGPTAATVRACGGIFDNISVDGVDDFFIRCASGIAQVLVGPVEILLPGNILVTVPSEATVTVTQVAEGQLHIENSPESTATDPILVEFEGEVTELYPGETIVIAIDICEGDFDGDGDVDGSDLAVFAADFGRTDCATGPPCEGDFDGDGDVDGSDLAIFAADFGRTDCP